MQVSILRWRISITPIDDVSKHTQMKHCRVAWTCVELYGVNYVAWAMLILISRINNLATVQLRWHLLITEASFICHIAQTTLCRPWWWLEDEHQAWLLLCWHSSLEQKTGLPSPPSHDHCTLLELRLWEAGSGWLGVVMMAIPTDLRWWLIKFWFDAHLKHNTII